MDTTLFRWFNALSRHTPWAHDIVTANADFGIVVFAGLLVFAALRRRRRGDLDGVAGALWAGAAPLLALAVGQVIGGWVDRSRPYTALHGVLVLVDRTRDFSFPSDHATVAGAVAAGLWFADRTVGRFAVVAAVAMALTRVYVGAHYPGDVLAGLALGAIIATGLRPIVVPLLGRLVPLVESTFLRRLVQTDPR